MDGLLFYWVSWLMWVIVTFLLAKNKSRTFLACWILTLITLSNTEILLWGITINASIVILLVGASIALAHTSHTIMNIFRSICLVFGYVGLLLWEQISPVWMFLPRTLMISIIGFIILSFLSRSFIEKCAIWCLGVPTGEIIHGLIYNSYGLKETIGDMAFLDLLFIELAFLLVATCLKEFKWKIDHFTQTIENQKKRWTHE